MGQYSIKDLEVLTGIKAHTLRIWEQRYNLVKPKRTDTNIRFYNDEQLKKILNIALLNNNGLKISKIALLSDKEINQKIKLLDENNVDAEKYINALINGMISMDKHLILKTLNKHSDFDSLQNYFVKVVFPFLNKIGLLWSSNSINPAQEHFASNIIKRFLIAEIERLKDVSEDAPTYVLILPEGEWHELSLLLAEFILKDKGCNVFYLGTSVPREDVFKILNLVNADFLLCVSILSRTETDTQAIIDKFSEVVVNETVLFAGAAFYNPNLSFPNNCKVIYSFDELVLFN